MDKAASVFLRADIKENDTEYLMEWLHNRNVTKYLSDDSRSAETVGALISQVPPHLWQMNLNRGGRFYMVDFGQMPIGFIKLSDAGQDECEIVVALGNESVWGRGYGYLAVSQCLRLAFFEHRVRKINANIYAENHRSTRLFERARFVRVGGDSRILHYSLTLRQFIS